MTICNEPRPTCRLCGGLIDDQRTLGIILWHHCQECEAWSAYHLHLLDTAPGDAHDDEPRTQQCTTNDRAG